MPLLQIGLTLHIARHFSATRFPDWIAQHRITVVAGVPTVLNILLQNSMVRLKDCASKVRLMTSSSAPLATHTWERFERESGIPVINLYGTSETGWICGNRLNERRMGTVGLVVSGVKLDIVNANRSSCKTGELGELVIESTKIALGTLQEDGSLLQIRNQPFFTRDLASRDENGFVRLIGRMDDLVIRGGVKISPGEIEDAILTHPDVCEAVVLCVPDKIYGQEAICFVVLRSTTTVDSNALVMHLKNSLPREKLPKSILAIDSIPRNIRGKVHLDALTAHWRAATQA
jgi:acyl-coenzyme A synthetase/AMP-(fatty) acid ligase